MVGQRYLEKAVLGLFVSEKSLSICLSRLSFADCIGRQLFNLQISDVLELIAAKSLEQWSGLATNPTVCLLLFS